MKNKDCRCKDKVKMSTPKGMEFNTPYTMNHTLHNEHYWDTSRNIGADFDIDIDNGKAHVLPFAQHLDSVANEIVNLLKEKTFYLIIILNILINNHIN